MRTILSLTTTHSRIHLLKYTLASLLDQTRSADSILVNLSREPYLLDQGIGESPAWLTAMGEQGVEIQWVRNTGPYRKLLPALDPAGKDDLVITCDDDVIYGPDWLRLLLKAAESHPDAIVCGRARRPVRNVFGMLQSYLNWPMVADNVKGHDLVPIGIAGVVYRSYLLADTVIRSEDFLELAPRQDDLWFNLAARAKGTPVVVAEGVNDQVFPVQTRHNLSQANARGGELAGWNRVLRALVERLGLRIRAYAGVPVCDNDRVFRRLLEYLERPTD